MAKRRGAKRGGRVTPKGTPARRTRRAAPPHHAPEREPDLMEDVAEAVASGEPLALLTLASAFVEAVTPSRSRVGPTEPELPPIAELVRSFVEVPQPETTALLAVLAPMLADELAARSARRELARRTDALPAWLASLDRAEAGPAVEVADVLGDSSNVMVEVRLADHETFTTLVHLDHAAGSAVVDGFVLPDRLEAVLALMEQSAPAGHVTTTPVDPAEARVRLEEGVAHGTMFVPPFESETWPACRPLVMWVAGLLPEGGEVAEWVPWTKAEQEALTERFFASEEGRPLDDAAHRALMDSVMWLGTGYGSGDPLRWSPNRVAELLLDLVPRKVMAPATDLAGLPDLLRALVAYGHGERGIPPDLTAQTLEAITELEPEYHAAIADDDRAQGPVALAMEALALSGRGSPRLRDLWAESLAEIEERAGGPEALAELDTEPLPDEPLDLAGVPDDVLDAVRAVAALGDEACGALLGIEARTAFRRLLARVAREGPEVFRRRGRAETAAAALCWAVARDGDLLGTGEGQLTARALLGHLGITGSISSRAGTLLRAAGIADGRSPRRLPPELTVSAARRAMVVDAGRFRLLLAAADEEA